MSPHFGGDNVASCEQDLTGLAVYDGLGQVMLAITGRILAT